MSRINVANFRHPDGTSDNINLDDSGRVLVGTTTAASTGSWAQYAKLSTQGNTALSTGGGALNISTGTAASSGISTGVSIGNISFSDSGGNEFALIQCRADNTTGVNDYPGRLGFFTTADGASSATERMRITSAGDLRFNSGYGSVATAYGCRAWVNFNGTGTIAIRDSGNVSSLTDRDTGRYTVNFTNAMPDINYCAVPSGNPTWGSSYNSSVIIDGPGGTTGTTTSACQIRSSYSHGPLADATILTLAVFR